MSWRAGRVMPDSARVACRPPRRHIRGEIIRHGRSVPRRARHLCHGFGVGGRSPGRSGLRPPAWRVLRAPAPRLQRLLCRRHAGGRALRPAPVGPSRPRPGRRRGRNRVPGLPGLGRRAGRFPGADAHRRPVHLGQPAGWTTRRRAVQPCRGPAAGSRRMRRCPSAGDDPGADPRRRRRLPRQGIGSLPPRSRPPAPPTGLGGIGPRHGDLARSSGSPGRRGAPRGRDHASRTRAHPHALPRRLPWAERPHQDDGIPGGRGRVLRLRRWRIRVPRL